MYKVLAPTPPSHSLAILAVNSGPLSEGMWAGHCPGHHQVRQRVDDVRGPDAPLRPDGQALPSVLVDQGQQPHRPAVPGPDMDKAIGHTWFLFSGLSLAHGPSLSHSRPLLGCLAGTFSPSRRQIRSTRL